MTTRDLSAILKPVGGTSCQRDQLAAQLGIAATGGSFNLRLITAKMFGLISYNKNGVSLTTLGQRIVDPQKEKQAKAEAFLLVPLYNAVYEQFKGMTLPGNPGLEGAMETLGVAPKQKDKARQVFQRSATQAGFFAFGNNRLVMPSIKASAAENPESKEKKDGKEDDSKDEKKERNEKLKPFLWLLDKLPEPETKWAIEGRKKWLQTAANIFDLMYESDGSSDELSITVKKDSANPSVLRPADRQSA